MPSQDDISRALLEIAYRTYRDEIVGELTGSKRYTGAMIANAMAIAAREMEAGDQAADLLAQLGADDTMDLAELAQAIRKGRINDESHAGLLEALLGYVREQLKVTNPRFLERRGG